MKPLTLILGTSIAISIFVLFVVPSVASLREKTIYEHNFYKKAEQILHEAICQTTKASIIEINRNKDTRHMDIELICPLNKGGTILEITTPTKGLDNYSLI